MVVKQKIKDWGRDKKYHIGVSHVVSEKNQTDKGTGYDDAGTHEGIHCH
jgi:hypothetical protein